MRLVKGLTLAAEDDATWLCDECGGTEFHTLKCPVAKSLRGSWCTPEWLAKLIGPVWLDPCTNERGNILADVNCAGGLGDDGLYQPEPLAYNVGFFRAGRRVAKATTDRTVFVNPPYGPGEVIKWVKHYSHTRFIFLLRWDPSTEWFDELIPYCTHVWFPKGRRINFEPPPRIKASSAAFPHALYLRHPSDELSARLNDAGYFIPVDTFQVALQSETHGRLQRDDRKARPDPGGRAPGGDADGRSAADRWRPGSTGLCANCGHRHAPDSYGCTDG